MNKGEQSQRNVAGFALIAAPALLATSTFFWDRFEVGITGGVVQVLSFVFWIPALLGLLALVRPSMPGFAAWFSLPTIYACIGGNNWAMDGIYATAYGAVGEGNALRASAVASTGGAQAATLFLPGLLFPITLVAIGIAIVRSKSAPSWAGVLLALGGISFPLSRIPRIMLLAHLCDLLIAVASIALALHIIRDARSMESEVWNREGVAG